MFKVLIVDDSYAKTSAIHSALIFSGVSRDDIEQVSDANSARNKIKTNHYDVLILDMVLPLRLGDEPNKNSGISLLRDILERPGYKQPFNIISLTYFPEVLEEFKGEFDDKLLTLIQYSDSSEVWKDKFQAYIVRAIAAKTFLASDTSFQSLLAVVCALDTPELQSLLRNGWKWHAFKLPNDHTQYYKSIVVCNESEQIVYAAAAARMGMPATAILSTKMINAFKPRYIAMTGITAGVKAKTKVADIIIADPVWDWGSGKWSVTKDEVIVFESDPYQVTLDVDLRQYLNDMVKDSAMLHSIKESWQGDLPDHNISVHIGPLASGASVLADGDKINNLIINQNRKLLGIEMEAYALYLAAQEMPSPRPKAFCMKSVVDFADGEKNDKYHKYASYCSAMVFTKFVEKNLR